MNRNPNNDDWILDEITKQLADVGEFAESRPIIVNACTGEEIVTDEQWELSKVEEILEWGRVMVEAESAHTALIETPELIAHRTRRDEIMQAVIDGRDPYAIVACQNAERRHSN